MEEECGGKKDQIITWDGLISEYPEFE